MTSTDPLLAAARAALASLLPRRMGLREVDIAAGPDPGVFLRDGQLLARLWLFLRTEDDEIDTMSEQEVILVEAVEGADVERIVAYLGGWVDALPALLASAGEFPMPEALVFAPVLHDDTLHTREDFAAALSRSDLRDGHSGLDPQRWEAFLEGEGLGDLGHTFDARMEALAEARRRFEGVDQKMQRVYGMRLPQQVAVFMGFWLSLTEPEQRLLAELGGLYRPCGVLDWFDPRHTPPQDVPDDRLYGRHRSDPPELVPMLIAREGDRIGLYYDDPACLPTGCARNSAAEGNRTFWAAPTLLRAFPEAVQLRQELLEDKTSRAAFILHHLAGVIRTFEAIDDAAFAEDEADAALLWERRWERQRLLSGVGVLGRDPSQYVAFEGGVMAWEETFRDVFSLTTRIDEAHAALRAGEPELALAVGKDLHWLDEPRLEQDTLALLLGAYRALGREALARIVEVHHGHRR